MSDHAPLLERAFAAPPRERREPVAVARGELPAWVRGSYYMNGPARFERDGVAYRHWLDGDGMVCALHLTGSDGGELVARFVRGAKWTAEEEAGRALFRTFGTAFPGDRLVRGIALASPVNVSVYPWQGRLLAFGEQGLPWELDPMSLDTLGPFGFGGALNEVSPFAAHPKLDLERGELVNFGISFAAGRPLLNLYRFRAEGGPVERRRIELPHAVSLHDFALGPRHAVFYLAPYLLDMAALAGDGQTVMQALAWRPELGTRLLVVERASGEVAASIPVGERYCLHTINCFEADGRLVVDLVELDRPVYDQYEVVPELFTSVSPGRPVRLVIDLAAGRLLARREVAYDAAPDFPSIDPRRAGKPYRDLWMLGVSATGRPGRKFFDQLVHVEWPAEAGEGEGAAPVPVGDLWQAPEGCYLGGEPAFCADPAGERAGAVICPLFDARRGESRFLVFDALDVAAGPLAELPLASPIHLGFHAFFEPAAGPG